MNDEQITIEDAAAEANGSQYYYTAPSDEIFSEVKAKAIQIWQGYDDTYGYASEKINRIKDIPNFKDNLMYMVAMFDESNQAKLAMRVGYEARKAIADRMKAGGQPDQYNPFLHLI